MATRAADVTGPSNGNMVTVTWTGLLNGDTGAAAAVGQYPDKTVQAVGPFGTGGSSSIEGSNDGGTTWGVCHDPQGTTIALTDSEPIFIAESPLLIRPDITAGDGVTDMKIYIAAVAGR